MKVAVNNSKLFLQAAIKWRIIGHLLKIPSGSLDSIGHDSRTADDALSAVFTVWSRTLCSPYSWKTILHVLATDAVGHRRLANDIACRLSGKIGDCICSLLHFIFQSVWWSLTMLYTTEPQHTRNSPQLPSTDEAQSPIGDSTPEEISTSSKYQCSLSMFCFCVCVYSVRENWHLLSSAVDYDTHDAEPEMSTLVEWISPVVINLFSNDCQINYIKVALIITVRSICHSSRS